MCSAGNARAVLSLLSFYVHLRRCMAPLSLLPLLASDASCLMHDTTSPRTYSARTISNLALASLVLPGVAVLPLTAANRKSA